MKVVHAITRRHTIGLIPSNQTLTCMIGPASTWTAWEAFPERVGLAVVSSNQAPHGSSCSPSSLAVRGRIGWQPRYGYSWHVLVEANIGRFKRVIGGALHSRRELHQSTKAAIAAHVLNSMLDLGRLEFVGLS